MIGPYSSHTTYVLYDEMIYHQIFRYEIDHLSQVGRVIASIELPDSADTCAAEFTVTRQKEPLSTVRPLTLGNFFRGIIHVYSFCSFLLVQTPAILRPSTARDNNNYKSKHHTTHQL